MTGNGAEITTWTIILGVIGTGTLIAIMIYVAVTEYIKAASCDNHVSNGNIIPMVEVLDLFDRRLDTVFGASSIKLESKSSLQNQSPSTTIINDNSSSLKPLPRPMPQKPQAGPRPISEYDFKQPVYDIPDQNPDETIIR